MPDFSAHYLFGTRLELPTAAAAYPALFNWGLQGPDPFFYRKVLLGAPLYSIGNRMHDDAIPALFEAMLKYCSECEGESRTMAEAYLYGFAGHYALDSAVHPYVFWLQQQWQNRRPEVDSSTLHCCIERDIDMDLYGHLCGGSPCDIKLAESYRLSPENEQVLGSLYANLLCNIYEILLSPDEVVAAFRDAYSMQKLLLSGSSALAGAARALGVLLGKGGDHYTCHFKGRQPNWDSLNMNQEAWYNPWNGEERHETVPQLMELATKKFRELHGVLVQNAAGAQLPLPISLDFCGKEIVI